MGKRLAGFAAVLVGAIAVTAGAAFAAGYDIAANCSVVSLQFVFDGKPAVPQVANGNPAGFICAGTSYVPLRFMAQALGKTVGFDTNTYTITVTTPGTSAAGGTGAQAQSWTDQGITFTNAQVHLGGDGSPMVNLEATNATQAARALTFTVSFFDSQGNLLGTADGAEMNIAAGQTKTETAAGFSSVQGYASIKVQVGLLTAPQ